MGTAACHRLKGTPPPLNAHPGATPRLFQPRPCPRESPVLVSSLPGVSSLKSACKWRDPECVFSW